MKKKEFLWGLRKETNFSQQQEMLHVDAEKKKMDERAEKVSEIISREHIIALLYPVNTAEPPTNKLSQVKLMTKVPNQGLHL